MQQFSSGPTHNQGDYCDEVLSIELVHRKQYLDGINLPSYYFGTPITSNKLSDNPYIQQGQTYKTSFSYIRQDIYILYVNTANTSTTYHADMEALKRQAAE